MRCDGDIHCKIEPMRAPALMVPHKFVLSQVMLPPRRMFTDLHYCELHRVDIDGRKLAQALLSAKVKQDFEAVARRKWPLGYTCDFERAHVLWYLVTTPEYRAFLASLGHAGIMGAAKLNTDQQQAQRALLGVKRLAG